MPNEKTKNEKPKNGKSDIVGKSTEEIKEEMQKKSFSSRFCRRACM